MKPISQLREAAERAELSTRIAAAKAMRRAASATGSIRLSSISTGTRTVSSAASYESAISASGRPVAKGYSGASWAQWDRSTSERVRWSCQHAERNSPTVRALVKSHQALVVGDGAIVRSLAPEVAWAEQADKLFQDWAGADESAGLGGPDASGARSLWQLCRLIDKAWLIDGDVLTVQLGQGSTNPGRVQLIEADRVRSPRGSKARVIDGVEMDELGFPKAFHVAQWSTYGGAGSATREVPAAYASLLCNPFDDRVGMVRGEPAIQASLTRIRRLDEFADNHAIAAHMATLFGLFIESENPEELQAAAEGIETQPQPSNAPGTIPWTPGSVYFGKKGEKLSQVSPEAPNANYAEYVRAELTQIAADVGLPISLAFFDPSGLSYIQMRAQAAVAMRGIYHAQAVLASFVRRIRSWKIAQWISEKRLAPNPMADACEVAFPDAPVFDLGAEVSALRDAVSANLTTQDQATQALGSGRARDVNWKRAQEVAQQRRLGIEPAALPGSKAPGQGQSSAPPAPKTGAP